MKTGNLTYDNNFVFLRRANLAELPKKQRRGVYVFKVGTSCPCAYCGRSFATTRRLNDHTRSHTGEKPYKCQDCPKAFSTLSGRLNHQRTHESLKPFECKVCHQRFKWKEQMKTHERLHTANGRKRPRSHSCKICSKSFSDKHYFVRHLETHTAEKIHKCHICQKGFAFENYLASHLAVHFVSNLHQCGLCPKAFRQKSYLRYHVKSIHEFEKSLACQYCKIQFPLRTQLEKHVRTHTGEKPHKCAHCQRTFTQSGSLKRHLRICSLKRSSPTTPGEIELKTREGGEYSKNVNCRHCMKSFSSWEDMEIHVKEEHRINKCDDCDSRFLNAPDLRKHHKRMHTGETSYKCELCDKVFKYLQVLKNHIKVHILNQEFPLENGAGKFEVHISPHQKIDTPSSDNFSKCHKCDICSMSFVNLTKLRRHSATHIKLNTLYKCEFCDLKFTSTTLRSEHCK